MATAWNGGSPIEAADATQYELGVAYRTNTDITITALKITTGAGELSFSNRKGRFWSSVGAVLATVDLPSDLPTGTYTATLDTPLAVTSGTTIVPSYSTGGNYSFLANALDNDVVSADGNVTALAAGNAPGGNNGRFTIVPGTFPSSGAGSHPYYGIDFEYTVGIGGNTAPRITDTSAVANQLQVTAAAVVEDDETLTGLTLRIEWGDGNADTVTYPTLSASHTYAAAGTYPLLFKATDASGATDFAADYVVVTSPDPTVFTLDIPGLQAAICGAAQRIGHLDTVAGHEPREAPNNDMHAAFWLLSIRPNGRISGLASAATVVTFLGRLYIPAGDSAGGEPADQLDVDLLAATDRLMAAFIGKFTLGGRVRNVDVFGEASPGLSADAGYVSFNGAGGTKKFRVMTITLPLIVNDMYEEVP